MIKRLLIAALIASPASAMAQKFGVVNTEQIINSLSETADAQVAIDAASAKYETEFALLKQEMEKKYTELQQLPASTPEEIRKRRVQELQELDQKITSFRQTATNDLEQQQKNLMTPIRTRVENALRQVGEEGDFLIIFNVEAPAYMRSDVIDVNRLVIDKLAAEQAF